MRIPKGWNEVTIGMYNDLKGIPPTLSDSDRELMAISTLTATGVRELKGMKASEIERLRSALSWSSQMPPNTLVREVTVEGVEYAMEPFIGDLALGAWIDIEASIEEGEARLDILTAALYRPVIGRRPEGTPIIEEYDGSRMAKRADLFYESLPLDIAHGALVFFSLIGLLSMRWQSPSS